MLISDDGCGSEVYFTRPNVLILTVKSDLPVVVKQKLSASWSRLVQHHHHDQYIAISRAIISINRQKYHLKCMNLGGEYKDHTPPLHLIPQHLHSKITAETKWELKEEDRSMSMEGEYREWLAINS